MLRKKIIEKMAYLIMFFPAAYLIKLSFFSLPTNVLEITIMVFLAIYFSGKDERENFRLFVLRSKGYLLGIGLIFFGLIVSMVINGRYIIGAGILKGWFVLPIIFCIAIAAISDEEKSKKILRSYYFSALAVSLAAIYYFLLGKTTFDGRLAGIFNSPNYLAMYLVPALIIGFFLTKKEYGKGAIVKSSILVRIFYSILAVLFLAVLYLTYSYAAWIALGAAISVFFVMSSQNNRKIIGLIVMIFIVLFFLQAGSSKFQNIVGNSGRSSLDSRLMIWNAAGKMITDSPFFGIGPGNFQEEYLKYQKYFPPYLEWAVPHPHNIFLTFWLYSGILGLAGFIFVLLVFFKRILSETRKSLIGEVSLVVILYILIHGMLDTTYFKNDLAIIFWMMIFLGTDLSESDNKKK